MSTAIEQAVPATLAAAPAKKSKLLMIIIIAVLAFGAGGAGIFFFTRSATAAPETTKKSSKHSAASEDDEEKADDKAAEETDEPTEKPAKDEKPATASGTPAKVIDPVGGAIPNDADVKQVVELQPFVVNLSDPDSARYLRVTLSIGLGGESGEEGKPDPLFVTRIRNAMLAVLTTKSSAEVLTIEGKTALRKQLLKAARSASDEPKVESIYITEFIVQM